MRTERNWGSRTGAKRPFLEKGRNYTPPKDGALRSAESPLQGADDFRSLLNHPGKLHFPCVGFANYPFSGLAAGKRLQAIIPRQQVYIPPPDRCGKVSVIFFAPKGGSHKLPVPHFNIKITQRSKGNSAVAGAAYQAGEKLFSEYDQKTKNYTCKKEVVYTEIMLPPNAPPEYADRATLWNSVEEIEKQWNSQLARRFVAALPREVPMELLPQMNSLFQRECVVISQSMTPIRRDTIPIAISC